MEIKHKEIEIIFFNNKYKKHIKTLNYEWLEKYFKIERGDKRSLSNPQEEIIDKGGFIYYAKLDSDIIGTISLIKKTDNVYEIGKMAVADRAKALG